MYFFERTLVRVLPTHTVSGPGEGVRGGARRPPPTLLLASKHRSAALPTQHIHQHHTHYTASTIRAPCGCHPSTFRLPCQPSVRGAFWNTHTNTNTHYTASSSIQAPFGCPVTPALLVHALERLRLCCSILLVRGIWDNEHNTHQTHFTSLCPGLRKQNPLPKIPPRSYKTIKFKQQIKRRYELHPGTQTTSW